MGFRLKITLKSERKFVLLASRPLVHWCEKCGCESNFVEEQGEVLAVVQLGSADADPHRMTIGGRNHLCLRSIADEP